MKLSKRVMSLKPSSTLAVTSRAKELKRQGFDVLSFAAGEPDFDTPAVIRAAAADALSAGLTRYVQTQGEPGARDAIARKLREENGIDGITADHVIISAGGKMCLYLAYMSLIDANADHQAVILTPAWVSYRPQAELAGALVVEVPASVENNFKITPDQLRSVLNERTRVVTINSPSNPCGIMYSRDELHDLAEVIVEHNRTGGEIMVLSDEIYEHITFGEESFTSFATCHEEISRYTITLNGLSKAYSMTGWRVGYAACPPTEQGEALVKAMCRLQAQMTTCISSFVYPAIPVALENAAPDVQEMRKAFALRAALAHKLLCEIPGLVCPEPSGAFYLFPDITAHFGKMSAGGTRIDSAVSFAEALLQEEKVAVVPGDDFGGCGPNHVRISFACSEEQIREGMARLKRFVESLS